MKQLPPDAPEWLEKSLNALEEKARELLRAHPNTDRSVGYFLAVEDFQSECDEQARLVRQKQVQTIRGLRSDDVA